MRILLAAPRGFCAGVNMAVEALDRALTLMGAPLYVFHEIVHNRHVVDRFRAKGAVFVNDLTEVPPGGNVMYSAHGVSPAVHRSAVERGLNVIDATCPLVRKVHHEAVRFAELGYTIVLIGHDGHDEVVGTLGYVPGGMHLVECPEDVDRLDIAETEKVAYLTQTTLSVDEANVIIERLKRRYPHCVGAPKEDICYATQNRQEALKRLLPLGDAVLVVGSRNSSNSNRLVEVAHEFGCPAWLVDDASELERAWFAGKQTLIVTAGASAPEDLVRQCVAAICEWFDASVEEHAVREEQIEFPLPLEVR
ncbi:MAG TPA: 4-hydroxy-3-methylbut-2-enyl diphosphate reductase [Pirellulales bacterium]|nr:4-hydroxy-3-methylbut-2-enyl diphosphate reductase [Pirellulales bacterium]